MISPGQHGGVADHDRARAHALEDVSRVGASDASGSVRESSIPERTGFTRREQRRHLLERNGEREEFLPHRGVDPVTSHRCGVVADPAVQEQDPVDARDCGTLTHPRPVLALGVEREPHFEAAERHLLHELLAIRRGIERPADRLRGLLCFGAEQRERTVAQVRGFGVLECVGLTLTGVPPVGDQAHQFVIAEQCVDSSSRSLCVPFELAQQVDGLFRIGSAVGHVAGLNQHRLLPDPPVARVDQPGRAKDGDEAVERAMHITDRHDALGRLDVARKGGGLAARLRGGRSRTRRDGHARTIETATAMPARAPRPGGRRAFNERTTTLRI